MKRHQHFLFAFLIFSLGFSGAATAQWDTLATIPLDFTFPVVGVANGKIHILGGGAPGGATTAHFTYDPATDEWEPKAAIPYASQQPAGAVVGDKIHFFGGGIPNSGSPVSDHYIYDINDNEWTEGASLDAPRAIHNALGFDNKLFSLGGQGVALVCQSYDIATDTWTDQNNLPDNQSWYGAFVSTEETMYRFCGGGYTTPNNNAHKYYPDFDAWLPLTSFPVATHAIKGAAIGDKIFLAGGYNNFAQRKEIYIYDTEEDTYELSDVELPIGRNYLNVVSLDSCLYVLGGKNDFDTEVNRTMIRWCPYAVSTSTNDYSSQPLTVTYFDGTIRLDVPEDNSTAMELNIIDLNGKNVFQTIELDPVPGEKEISVGHLPAAMYVVHLKTKKGLYVGKIISH